MGYIGRHRAPDLRDRRAPVVAALITTLAVGMSGSSGVAPIDAAPPEPAPAAPAPAPTTTAPAPTATPTPTPRRPVSCRSKGKWGTKPHVTRVGHHLATRFDVPDSKVGGYRAVAIDRQGHPAGLALDFTVGRATGDRLAAYILANRKRLGVTYVIWRQRLNYGSGWRPMPDRGGVTANHYDHVHVSFSATPSGAVITC